jgi:hypothetical protein
MLFRWVWRALALFLGKKAWAAYQRRRGTDERVTAGRGRR